MSPCELGRLETIHLQIAGTTTTDLSWRSISVRLVADEERMPLCRSDSPWLGTHALVLRRRPVEVLGNLLRENGEILPLLCNDADLVVFRPQSIPDALDEARSTVTRFSGGPIMRIERHVFRPEALNRGINAFKIPNVRVSPTFLGEAFVSAWQKANLTGLEFTRIWTGRALTNRNRCHTIREAGTAEGDPILHGRRPRSEGSRIVCHPFGTWTQRC